MQTITATIGQHHYQTTLSNSRHKLIADEPDTLNGTDLGPTPEEILMMSLAGCTAITLRMYADRKQWLVTQINVAITMDKQPEKTIFTRNISFTGTLTADEQQRLLQVANACPVHKILTRPIEINTNLT